MPGMVGQDDRYGGSACSGIYNIMANQYDKAMDWVEKGYELHDQNMPYIANSIYNLDPLHDNPRFIAIVEKMNLPLPED
jgi:hypothetical protein